MRSLLVRTGRIENQENPYHKEEESFNALQPQDKRAKPAGKRQESQPDKRTIIVGRSIQGKAAFHSLRSLWYTHSTSTPRLMGDQKWPFLFTHSSNLTAFLTKASSLLCAALLLEGEGAGLTQKKEFYVYGREGSNQNWAMRDFSSKSKRKGLMIELVGESRLVIRSERGLDRKQDPFVNHSEMRIDYTRYADDLLLGILGDVELLIEIQKRITHFLESGLNLWVDSGGSRRIAPRSTVEFLGTVIRKVPPRTTPIQLLRELEKRIRIKHRIHRTACQLRSTIDAKFRNLGQSIPIKELRKGMSGRWSLLDAVQLGETLGRAGVKSREVSVFGETVKHIGQGSRAISFLSSSVRIKGPSDQGVSRSGTHVRKFLLSTPAGRKASGGGREHWARSISSEFTIELEAPIKKILRRLRDRGLISRRRPWPIHVASLTNGSDGDILSWYAGIAISLLSYYRCRDNLSQVRRIVDYQIRWSAIFTSAHKHKSSARKIIQKYSKESTRVNQEGGQNQAEFPKSIELGKLGYGQDPKKK